jgi:hypothetical protein
VPPAASGEQLGGRPRCAWQPLRAGGPGAGQELLVPGMPGTASSHRGLRGTAAAGLGLAPKGAGSPVWGRFTNSEDDAHAGTAAVAVDLAAEIAAAEAALDSCDVSHAELGSECMGPVWWQEERAVRGAAEEGVDEPRQDIGQAQHEQRHQHIALERIEVLAQRDQQQPKEEAEVQYAGLEHSMRVDLLLQRAGALLGDPACPPERVQSLLHEAGSLETPWERHRALMEIGHRLSESRRCGSHIFGHSYMLAWKLGKGRWLRALCLPNAHAAWHMHVS